MHTKEKLQGFVKAGVEWLDNSYPAWYDKIDLSRFNFSNYPSCVIGQLNLWDKVRRNSQLSFDNGFDFDCEICDSETSESWETRKILSEEWINQIKLKLVPVKCITLNLTYEELAGRFPEKMQTTLKNMVFGVNQKQAEEWGISSYEFNARLK